MVSEVLLFLEYYKVVLGGALILVVTASEFIFFCRPSLLLTRKCDRTEKASCDEGVDGQIKHKEDFSQRIEIPFGHTFLSVKQTSVIKQTDNKF